MKLLWSRRKAFIRHACTLLGVAAFALAMSPVPSSAQVAPFLFVADQSAGTVRKYSATGDDLGVFAGGMARPGAITADQAGNIYVSEAGPINFGPGHIRKFSPAGDLLLSIPTAFNPAGLRVASDGTIYVADYFGHAIRRYSASGVDLGVFVSLPLLRADFVTFDASGNLYVTDFISNVIRRVSPAGVDLGNFVSGIGGTVTGIAFDDSGNLYAAVDSDFIPVGAPGTINKYSPVGAPLGIFASTGLFSPYGLAFDSAGNLYAANFGSGAVEKFSPSGTDLSVFAPGLSTPRDVVVVELVVSYACAGFEAPLQESLTLKHQVQRTIPLKIQLFSDGTPITDLNIVGGPPVVKVEFSADGGTPVDVTSEVVPVGHSSTGNAFGFDPVSGFWSFNLDTRPFAAPGTYTVTAQSGDTATYVLGPTCSGEFVRLP